MKKIIIALLLIIILGITWWLIAPIFFDKVVDERLEDIFLDEVPTSRSEAHEVDSSDIEAPDDSSFQTPRSDTLPTNSTPASESPPIHRGDSDDDEITTIASGTFIGLAGHSMSGTTSLLRRSERYFLRFEDDFIVDNAPDMFVHLGKDGEYDPEARLAKLKGNKGGQNYEVPAEIDVSLYDEVWVWCRFFSVPMGMAELE